MSARLEVRGRYNRIDFSRIVDYAVLKIVEA